MKTNWYSTQKKLQKILKHMETEHTLVIETIRGKIQKFLKSDENENTTY
jgi:hypothetical protein